MIILLRTAAHIAQQGHPHPQPLGKAGHPKVLTSASNAATATHSAAETGQHSGRGGTRIS
ncbi:hypothetical protein E2C01_091404 [Portunus trituberculatus]|uniref:Uncharacterized protein n=1 Tax=Portunus trituberculatus TaxID=210409 RepID=A0A5B7JIZ1_PORTR|nr:hypothetical protein [Portunus trituberculatus]